jgi:hypothetical protein
MMDKSPLSPLLQCKASNCVRAPISAIATVEIETREDSIGRLESELGTDRDRNPRPLVAGPAVGLAMPGGFCGRTTRSAVAATSQGDIALYLMREGFATGQSQDVQAHGSWFRLSQLSSDTQFKEGPVSATRTSVIGLPPSPGAGRISGAQPIWRTFVRLIAKTRQRGCPQTH